MSAADRLLARTVSGPLGRTLAFAGDLAGVLWSLIRREPVGRRPNR